MTKSFNYYDCVMPLLEALGWHGHARRIFEAVPYLANNISLTELRNLMANLGYTSKSHTLNLRHLPDELLPCLFISSSGDIYIIADGDEGVITATDCQKNQKITLPEDKSLRGTVYTFYEQPEEMTPRGTWLSNVIQRFHTFIYWLMGLGFLTTMLSLSSFIFA